MSRGWINRMLFGSEPAEPQDSGDSPALSPEFPLIPEVGTLPDTMLGVPNVSPAKPTSLAAHYAELEELREERDELLADLEEIQRRATELVELFKLPASKRNPSLSRLEEWLASRPEPKPGVRAPELKPAERVQPAPSAERRKQLKEAIRARGNIQGPAGKLPD